MAISSATTAFCSSLLCSTAISSSSSPTTSSFQFKFKFPAKSLRSPSPAVTQAYRSSIPSTNGGSAQNQFWFRRGLLFTATLPFLLSPYESFEESLSKAAELGRGEYQLMKDELKKVVSKGKAAGVLRLVFHDAGTFEMNGDSGGMNGSIIYELDRPENAGLKKSLKVLDKAKSEVDAIRAVSWADLIAVAGAEAVSLCGGPSIPISLGRLDSTTQDLVALSGAHTLGSKGFGDPTVFDNSYFKILLEKPWTSSAGMSSMVGLPSDRALVEDNECLRWITKYANDQNLFFEDFKKAYIKLVNSGARWRSL
ncbi:putative L-ascorbate peroxidase 6 isoform X2 [Ziziphus jujuba]|uniref:L-ascorbate peroxidase n=1 Tax=Ziziphus jujuba TaxID=326968 RepID=A0ABM3IP87_ZIZJJ|nr:putative L-ascorbate peroxidase 6 isoform X2 [Ziziphus jujuba]